jgi:ribA/ribD-fused uncharacterized protein
MMNQIYGFSGSNRFLSNFWVESDGYTNEHRFQAEKAASIEEKAWVLSASTPGEAKRRGRQITLRSDWDEVRIDVMYDLLLWKFSAPELLEKLLDTGDAELVEANTWNDTFWGVDQETSEGENWLGITLMRVRDKLRAENE